MAERRKGSRPPEKRRSRPSGDPPLRREAPADSRPQTPPRPPKNRAQRRAKGKRSSPPPSRPGAYTGQREEIAERTIRLRNKRAQGQMRRRRRRRRLMHVALVTIGLIRSLACKTGIEKVVLESYEKQTLMSKLTYDVYSAHNDKVTGEIYFTTDDSGIKVVVSGATYSTNALNNAVDCALKFAHEVLFAKEAD